VTVPDELVSRINGSAKTAAELVPQFSEHVVVEVTFRVTGTFTLEAPAMVKLICPENVPADIPVGFAEIVSAPGMAPLAGVTDSHAPPEVVAE
jgi:hypothetical protein